VSESESLQRAAAVRRWNILQGDVPLLVLVFRNRPCRNNLSVLKRMAELHRVKFALTGKRVCARIFLPSWRMAVAGASAPLQCIRLRSWQNTVSNGILLANQVVGHANVAFLADLQL
jgi:hypothetical protein